MKYPSLRFALFGNIHQTKKNQYVTEIIEKLKNLGVQVYVERNFGNFIAQELKADISDCVCFEARQMPDMDIAISIGGDGTFLGTAAQIGAKETPILGINTGRLGFLADVPPDGIAASLERVCQGNYAVKPRKALSVRKNGVLSDFHPYVLNEVAVLKHDNSSLIEIKTYVDDCLLTNYLADGLIVSTPTGSTGYSLSVGGPILVPTSKTVCISPVAPHSLSVRPVVVPDDVEIRLEVNSRSRNFLLACDGRSESLPHSTVITVNQAPHTVNVIKIEHRHFFQTLRDKLMWGADQRQ